MNRIRTGHSAALVLSGLGAIAALFAASTRLGSLPAASIPSPSPVAVSRRPVHSATLLQIAGISPEFCAAAGLTVEQTTALATRAREYLSTNGEGLQSLIEQERTSRDEVARLERRVQGGEQVVEDLGAARNRHDSVNAACDEAIGALRATCQNGLDSEVVSRLVALREQWNLKLPPEYSVDRRSEADATLIRQALAEQRRAQRQGREVSSEIAQVLANHRPSANAVANLASLSAYRQAWTQALNAR